MRGAGGFLGFLAAGPLVSAVGPYVAVALLALLTGFGALVVSGTPLHLIPERIRAIHDRALGRTKAEQVIDVRDVEALEPLKRSRPRRRVGVAEPSGAEQPFDSPLIGTTDVSGYRLTKPSTWSARVRRTEMERL